MWPSPGPERTGAQAALGATTANRERERRDGAEPTPRVSSCPSPAQREKLRALRVFLQESHRGAWAQLRTGAGCEGDRQPGGKQRRGGKRAGRWSRDPSSPSMDGQAAMTNPPS